MMSKMRFIYVLMLLVFLFQACQNPSKVEQDYALIVEADVDSITLKAAHQMSTYWRMITGRELETLDQCPEDRLGIYIGKSFADAFHQEEAAELKEDGFIISIQEEGIFLFGNDAIADLYAVNTFLEEQMGCVKLSATEDHIPQIDHPQFEPFFKKHEPAFNFRRILFKGQNERSFREWYKLDELDDWGMFVHTFHRLLPPQEYFQKHPEYYSLVNGRRLQDAQLCLSNPEVILKLIENLGAEMKKKPEKTIWSVSQNDAYNYCECDECQHLYDQYESYSGAYVNMSNQLAQAYPDKQISTLAYQFTREAPKNIQPLPNVNIMFCSIECNRSMPLAEDPRSQSFVRDMKDWSNLTSNIFMWDYVVQFKNYLTPFPNFPVLQSNIQFFRDHEVEMMFQQGSSRNWSDLSELKQYLIAKLLWNPDINVDSLATQFIKIYYQEAAPFIEKYYQGINRDIIEHSSTEFLNIYGFPSDYLDSYLSPERMVYYLSIMDSAELAVSHDSLLLNRVQRARMPVDFAYVDIAINHHLEEMPSIIDGPEGQEINPLLILLLDRMQAYADIDPNIKINERNFKLRDYKAFVLNKLEWKMLSNKLKNAQIHIKTKYSDLYPVGGAKALNDNLYGALDFHFNWLGFQGEDMIVDIDLMEMNQISEIRMHFLKAVNSWIFLPEHILIESSLDGLHYTPISSLEGDNEDQNYLVKSIPFVFNFEPIKTRYLRIKAQSLKTCPEWHRGFGQPSWIFIDEIIVN